MQYVFVYLSQWQPGDDPAIPLMRFFDSSQGKEVLLKLPAPNASYAAPNADSGDDRFVHYHIQCTFLLLIPLFSLSYLLFRIRLVLRSILPAASDRVRAASTACPSAHKNMAIIVVQPTRKVTLVLRALYLAAVISS
jgi:hypothetical protein